MKIALCFSGQARAFEQGYEYYKRNLLDHYDVDVYIHTWKFPGEDKLAELYKPVKIHTQVPPLGDFEETPKGEESFISGWLDFAVKARLLLWIFLNF
jgi:hypothetical protein